MKKILIACFLIATTTASVAHAQATRTWVSGVGDDVNPCSRTAPCKTFAGAISKTAAGGEIDALDPGGFGAVTITKSITIDGNGALAGILATLGSSGVTINAAADDVVILRNLSFEGAGTGLNGVRVLSAGQVHVENCTIQNFSGNGIITSAAGSLFVIGTSVKQIPNQGIYVQSGHAMIDGATLTGNGFGLLAGATASVSVKHTVASGNATGFAAAYTSSSELNLEDSVSSNNQYGVFAAGGATVRLSNTSLLANTSGAMFNDGSGRLITYGNNRFGGNAADGSFTGSIAVR